MKSKSCDISGWRRSISCSGVALKIQVLEQNHTLKSFLT